METKDSSSSRSSAPQNTERSGLTKFIVIWLGQTISVFGSGLAGFAIGVWIYQKTGSATQFAVISTLTILPGILLMPLAGALVDRWDRRRAMLVADTVAGAGALLLALCFYYEKADVWSIGAILALSSSCHAVRWPALTASIPLLVPKRHLGRAAGLQQTGWATGHILAPLLAAALLGVIGVWGIVLVNCVSFFLAVVSLLPIRIPNPVKTPSAEGSKRFLREDLTFGWRYIRARAGLMRLLLLLASSNFCIAMAEVLLAPLVLSFAAPRELSYVLFSAGLGMLVGGVSMGTWGGPRRRIIGILLALFVEGGLVLVVGLRPSIPLIAGAVLLAMAGLQVGQACSQAIWQVKVPPEVQGRVFSTRAMIATASQPLAFMVAGPLADYVFEPLLMSDGLLAASVGRVLGVGPGRGMGLMFVCMGVLMLSVTVAGSRSRRLRHLEEDLPDAIDDDLASFDPRGEETNERKHASGAETVAGSSHRLARQ